MTDAGKRMVKEKTDEAMSKFRNVHAQQEAQEQAMDAEQDAQAEFAAHQAAA